MDNPNAIHDTVWSWLSSSIRAMSKPSNAFTWVASAFNLLSAAVYYSFCLLKYSLKCCFLLPYYAIKSYCFVGRTFLSVVKRAPELIIEIFAATLFIGLLGCILFDIPREMRANDNKGRVVRAPADPPAPANTNDIGTNTTSTTANAPEADTQADGNAQTNDTVARAGTNVETEANNAEVERLKAAINAALEELMCPITFDLPVDPVVTEAGDIVARQAILALIRQRGMRTLRSMRTNQPMGQRIAPSVTIRNVIEKLVESGAVDKEVVTAWRSGRENLEGRGNDADTQQPPRRDRRGGIDGWLGVGALRRPDGEGGALDQLEALLDEANEMNEQLRAWMEEDEDEGEKLRALMEEDADEDNEMNEELQALMEEDAEDILQEEMRRRLGERGARRRRLPVMAEDEDGNDENQDEDEDGD